MKRLGLKILMKQITTNEVFQERNTTWTLTKSIRVSYKNKFSSRQKMSPKDSGRTQINKTERERDSQ